MLFRAQLLISTILAASSVLGGPIAKRDGLDPCKGLPSGSYSNASKFRLVAFKPNNSGSSGSELVLRRTGTIDGGYSATFTVGGWGGDLSLNEVLDMTNGQITGSSPSLAVAVEVKDNAMPYFVVTKGSHSNPPQLGVVWCAVPRAAVIVDSDPFDFLAANGRYDAWSLCKESTGASRVVYNVDKNKHSSSFDAKSCTSMYLRIVPRSPYSPY